MSGLAVSEVSVTAGGKTILDGVSLSARTGQLTGLIGPNGAGKSTLMRATLGLQTLAHGSIRFDGADLPAMPRRDRAKISAFVEQSGTTESHLSAQDVVMLGRIPFQSVWQATPSRDDEHAVAGALEAVNMTGFADRLYQTLSGGEQQRLQIARALAQQPRLLVLDEPTNHLDVHAQLTALALLQKRAHAGATVLLALHDLNLAAGFCDSLVVLHGGKVLTQGVPEAVLTPWMLRDVYGVNTSVLRHPMTGRPILAYNAPSNSD
ncbi:ABC transporter ATP-binding protein [Devosia naphthalenivorans]|uniref:ABC transporter ATP-binding protein n=1 Tax=Devosia naphthalenivorans TaxID=2082392 RepID=UPI000D3780B1|nr:ABC transporter ATP-binding protein [Devosia naphthalenivorans]